MEINNQPEQRYTKGRMVVEAVALVVIVAAFWAIIILTYALQSIPTK